MSAEEGREITLFHICEGESCILSATCVIGEISFEVQLMTEEETEIIAVHAATYQELIAKEVNSAREVVARMLRQFADEGWIEVERGAINIKDLDALRKLAK